jgi:hypothetical protein
MRRPRHMEAVEPNKQTNEYRNYDCAQSQEGGNQAVCRVKKVWESLVQENLPIMSLTLFSLGFTPMFYSWENLTA